MTPKELTAQQVIDADPGTLLTPAQVARVLSVNPKTVSRWAKDGLIDSLQTPGGHRRFPAGEVARYLRSAS